VQLQMMTNESAITCSDDLQQRWEQVRELGEKICQKLTDEMLKLGFEQEAQSAARWERVKFELVNDPATGQTSLSGVWTNQQGHKVGSIIFHCDGTFYAEYDVVQTHPNDPQWFIEAVNAWGKNDMIKTEPRLLPNLI